MKRTNVKKGLTGLLAAAMLSCMTLPAFAVWDDAIIDVDTPASITLHKYDYTNARKDNNWDDSYVSTGKEDKKLEEILGGAARDGDPDGKPDHVLGNGTTSNGYAIAGVEYAYLRVADIALATENTAQNAANSRVVYGFDKQTAAPLLSAIGLANGDQAYTGDPDLDATQWWYESDTLNKSLQKALSANATGVTNLLERYIGEKVPSGNGAQENNHPDNGHLYDAGRMTFTDADGMTSAKNLEVGLYLLVETKVPEMVTCTTNPCFISLPMTTRNGGFGGSDFKDGGHSWMYNVSLYPKNETGIVTLEKTVREAKDDSGKNNASDVITDGFAHNATASTNDLVEYQIISTLPSITSKATSLSTYSFIDQIAPGLTYTEDKNVKIQWYTDKECTNLVATWDFDEGFFTVSTDNTAHTRTISVSDSGLEIINKDAATAGNANNGLIGADQLPVVKDQYRKFAGFSNYTMRITYSARLNADDSFIFGDAGNENKVTLTWKRSNAAYYDTLLDDCHVYSYGVDLQKFFADKSPAEAYGNGSASQNMYNHVKFMVRNVTEQNGIHTAGYYVTAKLNESEGIWYVTGHTENESEATVFYPAKAAYEGSEAGHIIIKGLEDDNYELTELETHDGYVLLNDRIKVNISVNETTSYCDVYDKEIKQGVYQNDGHYNYNGCPELPLANIPQKELSHKLLTASATVNDKQVTMVNDFDPSSGVANASANAIVPLSVTNNRGFDLPQTGDTVGRIFIATGVICMVAALGAASILLYKKACTKK